MPLSIRKLNKMLTQNGFVPTKYFVMDNYCVYIEITTISNAEIFLLYIPSAYNFKISKNDDVYEIEYLDINETDNTADNYAGELDEYDIENKYREIDVNLNREKNDIESYLEKKYERDINLKNISRINFIDIKNIYRQLKRFRLCVKTVKYKIAIVYKNFLCAIKRDDSIEIYSIKKYPAENYKCLYITIDLELMYEKLDSVRTDIDAIKKHLYQILDKNQFTHEITLQKILDWKGSITEFSKYAYSKKLEYEKTILELYDILNNLNKSEKKKIEKIQKIQNKYNGKTRLSMDIEISHQIAMLENDLKEIRDIKEDTAGEIFKIKSKFENTMLTIDNIMFDNNVMIGTVAKNFEKLGKLI